jgi:hypothetical protein
MRTSRGTTSTRLCTNRTIRTLKSIEASKAFININIVSCMYTESIFSIRSVYFQMYYKPYCKMIRNPNIFESNSVHNSIVFVIYKYTQNFKTFSSCAFPSAGWLSYY